jgi:glutamate dehydrogenase/leucine dehydrogenase
VKTAKLTTAKGFLLLDLDDAPVSVGLVRSAPSILQSGATNMARSITYTFASFGIQAGGAQLGVNAKPDERPAAVAAAMAEVAPKVEAGQLLLDPGRGISEADLAPLRTHDRRPAWMWEEWHGVSTSDYLAAMGACAAAAAIGQPAEGRRVAIEGFGPVGLALARLLADRGASVVALGTGAGTVEQPGGFDVAALGEAWAASGEGRVKAIGAPSPAWRVFGADADVLFVGSKAGTLSHEGAEQVQAGAVVPIGPVPLTTKALLTLQRRDITSVPDFLALAGPHLAAFSGLEEQRAAAEAATAAITEAVKEAAGHADGLFLGACARAEAFLLSWQDKVPFGRPLA